MDTQLASKILGFLYEDLNPAQGFHIKKPLLAHYTSMTNLVSILRESQIWFSNPLYMNDMQEVTAGMIVGANIFESSVELKNSCGSAEKFNSLRNYWMGLHQHFADKHLLDTYVFSLSRHQTDDNDGKLSMWRGYGGNGSGAAIVLDTAKINMVVGSPLIISEVEYITNEQRVNWIKDKIVKLAELLNGKGVDDEDFRSAAYQFFYRLMVFSLMTKHKGFEEEEEWRVVYVPMIDKEKRLHSMFSYWNGPRGLEPKLKFDVRPIDGLTDPNLSLSNLIHSIILGPTQSMPFAKAMVQRMLTEIGKPEMVDRVVSSKIPYRFT